MFRWPNIAVLALLSVALLSNRWVEWKDGLSLLTATDVKDGYLPIAEAAPLLPAVKVPFHKAQRFCVPYLAGLVSKGVGVSLPFSFGAGVALLQIFSLLLFGAILAVLAVPPSRSWLAVALVIFQPYALRYYWIVPGMVSDVAFTTGALLAVLGLARRKGMTCAIGLALAVLARQTALLMLPGLMLWLLAGPRWRELPGRQRCAWALGLAGGTVLLYALTGAVASRFGTESVNGEHLLGIFDWLQSPGFSLGALSEHVLRCTLPLLPAAALLMASRKLRPEAWFLTLMAAGIAAQPFLAGPVITGQNAARLVTLGLPFLVLAWACAGSEWAKSRIGSLGAVLLLGSLHHLYTVVGPSSAYGTALLQIVVTLGAFALGWGERLATPH